MVILNSVSMLLPRRLSLNSRYSVNVLVYDRTLHTEDCTIAYYDYKNNEWYTIGNDATADVHMYPY